MKQTYIFSRKMLLFICMILIYQISYAQTRTVSGVVTDADDGTTLPGVTISIKGTTQGTISDINGNYKIKVEKTETLVFSYVGYSTQEKLASDDVINVLLEPQSQGINEIVIIGYGVQRKGDATGAVTAIGSDDFNKGAITAPTDLLVGRVAGVQITTGGGAPGSEAQIRIRGGSSLSASNDPLIVIDGVPIDNEAVSGMRNPLNIIHPNDIETFTVLKDASATAIYGSRASNGVIIITTKKGKMGSPLRLSYSGKVSFYTVPNRIDVLSGDEFRTLLNQEEANNPNALALLGTANTDWQNEIIKSTIGFDHNISASGAVLNTPYRISIGYSDENGILETSELKRITGSFGINPKFFDNHLSLNINAKGMNIQNRFPEMGAVGAALAYDPTQTTTNDSPYGGYTTWVNTEGSPIGIAVKNPIAMLQMREDLATVNRVIGNTQADYKFHFLPDLHANLNLGYDHSKSEGTIFVPQNAPMNFNATRGGGIDRVYEQEKKNELLDFYFNYKKEIKSINSKFDVMTGYSWQHFWRKGSAFQTNIPLEPSLLDTTENTEYATESYLVSFFTRVNYTFLDQFLLTYTLRNDGSSRFSPETRWGLFSSYAFAWKIKNGLLKDVDVVSDLKLRLGYGTTGQQNIGQGDYPYLPTYTYSEPTAQYQFGNTYYNVLRPNGYDLFLKWEETTTSNIGIDFGFFKERITGSVDVYYRETKDLLNEIDVTVGTNLTNRVLTNVGNLENKGIEIVLLGRPIVKNNMFWELGFNLTYNENKITKLTARDDPNFAGIETGAISGIGTNIQIHSVDYASNSFYVYHQVYGTDGMPIEGAYVDVNNDGQITDADKYHFQKPAADFFMGFSSMFEYENFSFAFAGHINLGNYVYNNVLSGSTYSGLYHPSGFLNNITSDAANLGFNNRQSYSDYFVTNASFLRMDNITFGYDFKDAVKGNGSIRLSATIQNAFVITNYEGLDPEVQNGIDNNIFPRPRTYVLGININF